MSKQSTTSNQSTTAGRSTSELDPLDLETITGGAWYPGYPGCQRLGYSKGGFPGIFIECIAGQAPQPARGPNRGD